MITAATWLLKNVLLNKAFWMIALVALLGWAIHWNGYKKGEREGIYNTTAVFAPQLATAKTDLLTAKIQLGAAEAIIRAYRQTVENQTTAHKRALSQQAEDNRKVLAQVKSKLDRAEVKLTQFRKALNEQEIAKLVTPKADQQCVVSAGFVSLHNQAASRDDSDAPSTSFGIPQGGAEALEAASGIALSEVAATVADNYAACAYRGAVIRGWQQWYRGAFTAYSRATEAQQSFTSVVPGQ